MENAGLKTTSWWSLGCHFAENGYPSVRYPNMAKVNIHEHRTRVTRFKPLKCLRLLETGFNSYHSSQSEAWLRAAEINVCASSVDRAWIVAACKIRWPIWIPCITWWYKIRWPIWISMYHLVFAMTSSSRLDPFFTSAEREGKGFATLRKVDFFWQDWGRKVCRFSVLFGCLTK